MELHSILPTRESAAQNIIHFIGIGGIGMSGIAEILHNLGYYVQGSDISDNANTHRLKALGVRVFQGHDASHVQQAAVVVFSSAVKPQNPELCAAFQLRIPTISRADMLAELMRMKKGVAVAGTHGKTTTTSLVAALFSEAGMDPTVVNGGIINVYGSNARLGKGHWIIAEADESDGSFLKLPANIGVVTNIDPEHMEYYGTYDKLLDAFQQFVERLAFDGFGVLCSDHPQVQQLAQHVTNRKIVTYGIASQGVDVRAVNIQHSATQTRFDVMFSEHLSRGYPVLSSCVLPTPGAHNVSNALAAIAIGKELGFTDHVIRQGLSKFHGVKRRFTITGRVGDITVVDDYGHHPREIAATLATARHVVHSEKGRVIAVIQPHRYSRVHYLFAEFCECVSDADIVVLTPIYEAGETPIEGVTHTNLAQAMAKKAGHARVLTVEDCEDLPQTLAAIVQPHDIIICLGAGNITSYAGQLPDKLAKLLTLYHTPS